MTSPRKIDEYVPSQQAPAVLAADFPRIPRWKRALDILCVLIAIPSLLPMLLMIAILIKVSSKGPVLFKQERIGFLGRRFILFKFRTMIDGADTTAHEKYVASLIETNGPMTKIGRAGRCATDPCWSAASRGGLG